MDTPYPKVDQVLTADFENQFCPHSMLTKFVIINTVINIEFAFHACQKLPNRCNPKIHDLVMNRFYEKSVPVTDDMITTSQ